MIKEIKILGKEIEVKSGLKIDRVLTKTDTGDIKTCIDGGDTFNLKNYGEHGILKTNVGKVLNEGLNMGATPKEAQTGINDICDGLEINIIKHNVVEYCIDVVTDFKLRDNKNIFDTFSKMLGELKFKDTCISYDNTGKEKTISKQLNKNMKGIKGKKSRCALKLYSKLEEKGFQGECDKDIIRFEVILYSRALDIYKIENLEEVQKVKEEILKYIEIWEKTLPKKVNRYTKNTKALIEMIRTSLEDK